MRVLTAAASALLAFTIAAPQASAQDVASAPPGQGTLIELDDAPRFQLYLMGGASRAHSFDAETKGVNTLGGFVNDGNDHDNSTMFDYGLGLATQVGSFRVRAEIERTATRTFTLTTPSFVPTAPTFMYHTRIDNRTVFGNVWLDVPLGRLLDVDTGAYLSFGGGLGTSHTDLKTSDGVVHGSDNASTAAWMLGATVGYAVTDWMSVDVGVRRIDLGTVDTRITSIAGAVPGGNYGVDMESDEAFARLRVNFVGF